LTLHDIIWFLGYTSLFAWSFGSEKLKFPLAAANHTIPIKSGSICHSQLIVIDDAIIARTSLKIIIYGGR